jgi:hypothetical protein
MAKVPSMDTNIPGVWYGLHYYSDEGTSNVQTLSNTVETCFDTTNYRHTFTLSVPMTVRVQANLLFMAYDADGWRQPTGFINNGTGAASLVGNVASCFTYHYQPASGRIWVATMPLFGQVDLAAGAQTIEIRVRTYDASTAYTKFTFGSWAIDVKR